LPLTSKALTDRAISVAKAKDLEDLLDHIAWTDTLRPALVDFKNVLASQLVQVTLGHPIEVQTSSGNSVPISREQLAGQIYGIDWLMKFVERVLDKGHVSADELKRLGISLSL
jgi:hypothetical protein